MISLKTPDELNGIWIKTEQKLYIHRQLDKMLYIDI